MTQAIFASDSGRVMTEEYRPKISTQKLASNTPSSTLKNPSTNARYPISTLAKIGMSSVCAAFTPWISCVIFHVRDSLFDFLAYGIMILFLSGSLCTLVTIIINRRDRRLIVFLVLALGLFFSISYLPLL